MNKSILSADFSKYDSMKNYEQLIYLCEYRGDKLARSAPYIEGEKEIVYVFGYTVKEGFFCIVYDIVNFYKNRKYFREISEEEKQCKEYYFALADFKQLLQEDYCKEFFA